MESCCLVRAVMGWLWAPQRARPPGEFLLLLQELVQVSTSLDKQSVTPSSVLTRSPVLGLLGTDLLLLLSVSSQP